AVQAATIKQSIMRGAEGVYATGYRKDESVADWSTWDPAGVTPKWRGMWYSVYNTGCTTGCGTNAVQGDGNVLREVRQLNATVVHAFGYAYKISGEERFRQWGDEVFDATYGKSDVSLGYGLPDYLEKQYNQAYRSGGRYLAWRGGGVSTAPTPAPTPTPTPTPTSSATPTPTPTPTPSATPTPTPTPNPRGRSSDSVGKAKKSAQTLSDQLSAATLSGVKAESTEQEISMASEENYSQFNQLLTSIEQARNAFLSEKNLYPTSERINNQLLAALYLARASDASSKVRGTSANVRDRLSKVISHLEMAEDLTHFDDITKTTLGRALSVKARPDIVIGIPDTRSSASFTKALAPASLGAIVTDVTQDVLATREQVAPGVVGGPLPYELAGISVTIDGRPVTLLAVSPTRVEFSVPSGVSPGQVEVIVTSEDGRVWRGVVAIVSVSPGVFTIGAKGVGEALVLNAATYQSGTFSVTTPETLSTSKRTRLMLFATGLTHGAVNSRTTNDIRNGDKVIVNYAEGVQVSARTSDGRLYYMTVEFAGAQGSIPGLDQITFALAPNLEGAGNVTLEVLMSGRRSNKVTINVK
ncbi:MAG: hypothetical protein M3430_16285, partial [Acidobacteriota bacterium]|nr:hypothetical protein [Acidobacteriota bacterium]